MTRGFGFKIDYDKALRQDAKDITALTLCIEQELFVETINAEYLAGTDEATDTYPDLPWYDNAWDYFTRTGTIEEAVLPFMHAVTKMQTLHEYIHWMQRIWESYPELTVPEPTQPGWKERAQRNRKRLDLDDLDMDFKFPENLIEAKAKLKRAKASLSRHKRNQKKFG